MKKLIALTLAIMLIPPVGMYTHYVSLSKQGLDNPVGVSSTSGTDASKPTSTTTGSTSPSSNTPSESPSSDSQVLGVTDNQKFSEDQIYFTVNIPSTFKEDISAPNIVYSVNGENGDIEIETRLVAGSGISVQGRTINNTGILTLIAGTGITVDGNTITNDGIVSLTAGTGIEIDGSEITNTYTFTPDYTQSGWTDNGSSVVLTTTTDTVTVGALIATSLTSDGITLTNGNSILPDTDLGSDLGSTTNRFNNLWVANINSNSSQSFSGQTTFSYPPTDTTLDEASVLINPTTSAASGQLLGLAIAGYQKAMIDEDGDITLGYQDQTSAPASDYPLNIYGHSGTRVSFVDTTGNAYFAGNVGIGTMEPNSTLHVYTASAGSVTAQTAYDDLVVENNSHTGISILSPDTLFGGFVLGATSDNFWAGMRGAYNSSVLELFTNKVGGEIALSPAGTVEAVRIDSSGNVGIGTTSPGYKLEVTGKIYSDDTLTVNDTGGVNITLQRSGINEWGFYLPNSDFSIRDLGSSNDVFYIEAGADSDSLKIQSDGDIIMNAGNIGIGTTSPGAKLHIVGTEDDQQFIIQANGTQTANIFEWQNSSGIVLGGVDERGILFSDGGKNRSVYIGDNAGNISTTGDNSIGIGEGALSSMTVGGGNIAIGYQSGKLIENGLDNIFIGNYSGDANIAGRYNVAIGNNSLSLNTSYGTTAIGYNSGKLLTTGSNNIFLGRDAGSKQTTNSNLLIIGNQARADTATELSNSIIYGVMDATATNQSLRVNGEFQVMSGNVGIGTTAPGAKLEISSNITDGWLKLATTNGNPIIESDAGLVLKAGGLTAMYTDGNNFGLGNVTGVYGDVNIRSGNLGIGTTSPVSKLEIDGSALTDTNSAFRIAGGFGDGEYIDIGGLRKIGVSDTGNLFMGYNFGYDATNNSYEYDGSDEASGMEFTTAGEIKFLTAAVGTAGDDFTPTARMTIDNNGNVGIGTTEPSTTLDIVGTVRSTGVLTPTSGSGLELRYTGGFGNIIAYNRDSPAYLPMIIGGSTFGFYVNNTSPNGISIKSSGNVGIGTANPGEILEVIGNIKTSSLTTGTVYSNSGVLTNTDPSDRNLKHNILTLEDGTLDKVLGLRPVSFNWNSTGDGGLSFIAQEVNEIFPELVGTNNDGTLGLYTTQFIPVLAKAIQEQQLEIDEIALSTASADLSVYATLADTSSLQDIIDDFKAQLANSITSITGYFDEVFAREVNTEKLCIEENEESTCITGDQLKQILDNLPSPTPTSTPESSASPTPEPSATPIPSSEPSPITEATESATQ